MKSILFLISFFIITLSGNFQSLDMVSPEKLLVNSSLNYQTSKSQIISIMGDPVSVTTEYWEMDEEDVEKLTYPGAVFYLKNNTMESFCLTSPEHSLKLNNTLVKTGNNISTLQSDFPASYNNRGRDGLSINIAPGDYKFILVHFDSGNIITKIEQRYY